MKYNRPRKNPDLLQRPNKTKNFLTFFKNAHRDYLELFRKNNKIENHPTIQLILFSKENKVTLKDFEKIYKLRQLTACWISMFQ